MYGWEVGVHFGGSQATAFRRISGCGMLTHGHPSMPCPVSTPTTTRMNNSQLFEDKSMRRWRNSEDLANYIA